MSILRTTMLVLALASCTKVPGTESQDRDDHGPGVIAPKPAPAPAPKPATVTLMSVTFGDDCGGLPPTDAPASVAAPSRRAPASVRPSQDSRPDDVPEGYIRRCVQTSMQLSIAAGKDSTVQIKSVEVMDETGKSLGTLGASSPTRWTDASSAYEAWDQKVTAGKTALVSYVLSQPAFINRWDSHDRMYTVKVTASVGGVDQALQTTVMVVAQPAPMPT